MFPCPNLIQCLNYTNNAAIQIMSDTGKHKGLTPVAKTTDLFKCVWPLSGN